MRNSLGHLTRENQSRLSLRVRNYLKARAFLITVLLCSSWVLSIELHKAKREVRDLNNGLVRVMAESAGKGCPVFAPPSTIIVSGDNPRAMRRALDIAVQDLENFNVTIGKFEDAKTLVRQR